MVINDRRPVRKQKAYNIPGFLFFSEEFTEAKALRLYSYIIQKRGVYPRAAQPEGSSCHWNRTVNAVFDSSFVL